MEICEIQDYQHINLITTYFIWALNLMTDKHFHQLHSLRYVTHSNN
jgi:hypothetical protein